MRFRALDGWRGFAAILVALFHLSAAGWFYDLSVVRHGGIAVPLFFVLSGFVISHAYGDRLRETPSTWRFVVRRFGRLYPLHLFTLGVLVGLELVKLILTNAGASAGQDPFSGSNGVAELATNVLLLQGILPSGGYSWNAPSWSVGGEWAAYLAFAAVTLVAGPRAKMLCIIVGILLALTMLAVEMRFPTLHVMHGKGLLLAVSGFFAGAIVHQGYQALRHRGWKGGTTAEIVACLIFSALFWARVPGGFLSVAGFSVLVLVFAFEGGVLSHWLKRQPMQFLGRISYSIYLVHFVLLSLLTGVLRMLQSVTGETLIQGSMIEFGPPGAMDALAVIYLLVVILCSWATYLWVEVPGRTFFNALSDRKPLAQAWRAALADVMPAPAR